MALITFFQIGTTDMTPFIDLQNFKVNSEDVYETWTDGNYNEHREIARTRIVGTLKLGFSDLTEFDSFRSLMASNRNANGYYPIQIYVNNLNSTESINAFVDPVGEAKWDQVNGRQWLVVELAVRGR